jgi:photosystem II stability/assembly factor-like uncharacterized protein
LLLGLNAAAPAAAHFDQGSAPTAQAPAVSQAPIRQFGRAGAAGWVVLGDDLYWSATGDAPWARITPGPGWHIEAVYFHDERAGLALLSQGARLNLVKTTDGGQTWKRLELSLFSVADPASQVGGYFIQFITSQVGWLVAQQATSSNFSSGVLFRTQDGGQTWERLPVPIGGPAYFSTDQNGWVAGGPTGADLFHTVDGGRSWQRQSVGAGGDARFYQNPLFSDPMHGFISVGVNDGAQSRLELFRTDDGGQHWFLAQQTPVTAPFSGKLSVPQAFVSAGTLLLAPPTNAPIRIIESPNGSSSTQGVAAASAPSDIVALASSAASTAFALTSIGQCLPYTGACTLETQLWHSEDGGLLWSRVELPAPAAAPTPQMYGRAGAAGQGFDKCDIAPATQMQAWRTGSPYRSVNLYIGGSQRSCTNALLSASFVLDLARQGWTFIPTWVGPQAGGNTCCTITMSSDPTTAYNQGLAEANAAADTAAALGFGATVIYYDLENYDISNATYRSAAKAFISGWTGQLRARGHQAGVYAASCASAPIDFTTIANVPDAIWLANWYNAAPTGTYDSYATVWGVSCLDDTYWGNHQRIRQYAGGHNETWAGVTFNIDSNVVDGLVATRINPPGTPLVLAPANNATVAGLPFNVQVQAGTLNETGLATFTVDIATDSAFNALVFHIEGQTGSSIPVNVPQAGSYWLRARQGDGCCAVGPYSAAARITVGGGTAAMPSRIPPPILVVPRPPARATEISPWFD